MPKARRRGRRPLQPVRFSGQLALSTLANETVLSVATQTALEQDFHVISTDLVLALRGGTAGEGPIDLGLAAEDYSVTEIGECLNAQPLRSQGAEYERSRRRVRTYAILDGVETTETVNDGRPIRKKMFLHAPAGQAPAQVWARNRSNAALTGGQVIEFSGVHWGRWQ